MTEPDPCCCTPDPDGGDFPDEACAGCSDHCDYDTRPVCERHLNERDRARPW